MLKSMTGFGRAWLQEENWTITWEIRSLNSRHLDLKWKIPPTLYAQQKIWEKEIRAVAGRGGVELFLGLKITNANLQSVSLDTTMAKAMLQELSCLATSFKTTFEPDLNRLLAIPALWRDMGSIDNKELISSLTKTLCLALADWDATRVREGNLLAEDLRVRFAYLKDLIEQIRILANQTASERLELLRERMAKLLAETEVQLEAERITQELAIIADRIDISEELTRLDIHLQSIDRYFHQSEPVGRKLDFMVQECFREINTCGNKCQNIQIGQLVVDFKAELEKCREQIQNLE